MQLLGLLQGSASLPQVPLGVRDNVCSLRGAGGALSTALVLCVTEIVLCAVVTRR